MAYLELKLYQTIEEKYGTNSGKQFQDQWGRYLDDCFINWDTNMGPINEFHQILNNLHPSIKFTMEYNKNEMNFLDIKMIVKGENILTDIFYKATDIFNYVPFKSVHTKHTLLNIPYNLARRLCTIVDERMTLEERFSKLEQVPQHLGYPQHIIKNGIEKAKRVPQETLRRPKELVHNNKILTFVSTDNPRNPNLLHTHQTVNPNAKCKPQEEEIPRKYKNNPEKTATSKPQKNSHESKIHNRSQS